MPQPFSTASAPGAASSVTSDGLGNIIATNPAPSAPAPQIIDNEVAALTGASSALAASNVYLWAFEITVPVVIVGMRWRNAATATGATNMGIYTAAGNFVAGSDTGAVTDVANAAVSFTYGTPLVLAPGQYYLALACNNGTDTFQGVSPLGANGSRAKKTTNNLAAGALPLTTGVIITNPSVAPAMSALVSGGIA